MDKEPRTFTALLDSQITSDTQFYTQVPGGALADGDYRFTVDQLRAFLVSLGLAIPFNSTEYLRDSDAIAAGASAGEWYYLASGNDYGIPTGNGGIIKQIQ